MNEWTRISILWIYTHTHNAHAHAHSQNGTLHVTFLWLPATNEILGKRKGEGVVVHNENQTAADCKSWQDILNLP
jgi:hypothetical protein